MNKQTIMKVLILLAFVFALSITAPLTIVKAQGSASPEVQENSNSGYLYGDANGDGIVDASDVLLLRKYMANYNYDTGESTVVLGPPQCSHSFTQQNTEDKYLKSEATCTKAAEYYYSCTCGETGTETFESGATIPHTYDCQNTDAKYLKSEATQQSPAVYYYSCTCGDKCGLTFYHGNALGDYLAPVFTLSSDGNSYAVSGATGDGSILEIPETHDGLPVVAIANNAFYDNTKIKKVDIPDSVTSIGYSAFEECSSLESIIIPDSVTSIGSYAFCGCSSLESITIPFIGDAKRYARNTHFGYIFGADSYSYNSSYVPKSLKTVVITGGTSIGSSAFEGCSTLESIIIPDSVTSIGNSAFDGCSGLTSVTIGNGVTSIGICAFYDCSSLTSITIPDSVTSIKGNAFYNCNSLTDVYITDIAKWCEISFESNPLFHANLYLNGELVTELVIPDSVTSIGSGAFHGCSSLSSIIIHDRVTSIGDDAFSVCSGLTSITVNAGNTRYHSVENCLIETNSRTLILGCKKSVIPSDGSVKSIGSYAFWGCSGLTSITIPDSVKSIGYYAFSNCSSLTSVTIGNGVTSIGYEAFSYCRGLTSITIPDSVTSIDNRAFEDCSGLTSVTIGNGVTSIGDYAFRGCSGLESITIPFVGATKDGTSNTHFGYIFGASICSFNDSYVPESLKTVVITGGTSIDSSAFLECSGITSVTIGNGVTSIGNYAFDDCSSLTSITIPDSVTSIGICAFYDCSSLTSITFEDTSTWYRTTSSSDWGNMTGGTSTDVTNPSTNATYFKSTYRNYYWYKK